MTENDIETITKLLSDRTDELFRKYMEIVEVYNRIHGRSDALREDMTAAAIEYGKVESALSAFIKFVNERKEEEA